MGNINLTPAQEGMAFSFELPNACPICKNGITPKAIYCIRNSKLYNNNDNQTYSLVLGCPSCNRLFVGIAHDSSTRKVEQLEPQKPEAKKFDPKLENVSSAFIEIYHQAQAAEAYKLTQISGIGYRKALEFLIKDYATNKEPSSEDEIKETLLSKCINKYIDHPNIKATSIAATWIGNDETHYVRKWEDKDISDLKRFIDACVYWILADYDAEEALKMINP